MARSGAAQQSLNTTQTSHKHQINNFFSLGSGTNSKTAVGLNSSIGNNSNAQNSRVVSKKQIVARQYDSNDATMTPQSMNTGDKQRIQSYLRSSGQQNEVLKIHDLVTNASQDVRQEGAQLFLQEQAVHHASGCSNVTSSDIR